MKTPDDWIDMHYSLDETDPIGVTLREAIEIAVNAGWARSSDLEEIISSKRRGGWLLLGRRMVIIPDDWETAT